MHSRQRLPYLINKWVIHKVGSAYAQIQDINLLQDCIIKSIQEPGRVRYLQAIDSRHDRILHNLFYSCLKKIHAFPFKDSSLLGSLDERPPSSPRVLSEHPEAARQPLARPTLVGISGVWDFKYSQPFSFHFITLKAMRTW